jgi:hypothetical protein
MPGPDAACRAALLVMALLDAGLALAADPTPAPTQELPAVPSPGEVPMNHQLHAGQYQIPCLACHVDADRSSSAGIPSARKCMGCHKLVARERPGVQILARRLEQGQGLRWTRVYAVPDFIYFSHRVHVLKGVDCEACHPGVASSVAVDPSAPAFTMGRCLECHQARNATQDCLACHK